MAPIILRYSLEGRNLVVTWYAFFLVPIRYVLPLDSIIDVRQVGLLRAWLSLISLTDRGFRGMLYFRAVVVTVKDGDKCRTYVLTPYRPGRLYVGLKERLNPALSR